MRSNLRLRGTTMFLLSASAVVAFSALATTPASAVDSAPAAAHAATAGWTYYATYPDYASCVAAGKSYSRWQCLVSDRAGAFDLYVWA
jgi:hypothetical protein